MGADSAMFPHIFLFFFIINVALLKLFIYLQRRNDSVTDGF